MERQLLKLLLNHKFYLENKSRLIRGMFPDEFGSIYNLLDLAHDQYKQDLTTAELYAIYENTNPAATRAAKYSFKLLLDQLNSTEPVSQDIGKDIVVGLWKRETARQCAEVAIDIINGQSRSLNEIRAILEKVETNPIPIENHKIAPNDIDELLDISDAKHRFLFNLFQLRERCVGIGRGETLVIFARPETGKTASWISLTAGVGGWAEQGHSVHIINNEEPAWRNQLRCISAYSGMSIEDIRAERAVAKERYAQIKDKVKLIDSVDFTIESLDNYARENKPDILIVDQLDKIHIDGSFARTDERLKAIYVLFREICKRRDLAGVAICQASAEAEGKTVLSMDMMENSRTGKAAEADMVIGIGKSPLSINGDDNRQRTWNVLKNKITGWHGSIHCTLEQKTSRYNQ